MNLTLSKLIVILSPEKIRSDFYNFSLIYGHIIRQLAIGPEVYWITEEDRPGKIIGNYLNIL